MCTICGCATASLTVESDPTARSMSAHDHPHLHQHSRDHEHAGEDAVTDFLAGPAGIEIVSFSQQRTIRIERDILAKNDAFAAANRARLRMTKTFALNFVSSPGSGKTSLLVRMIEDLRGGRPLAVIEGDQQTSRDAERIRAAGAPAVQLNTGKGCHLDAHMVGHGLDNLTLEAGGLLFIENVGNLVCPAAFDLGEAHKVVVLSVTEGEDKPLKYPDMFAASDLMLLNKSDLLPHLEFDEAACRAAAARVNPRIEIMTVSAKTGDGLPAVYAWIEARLAGVRAGRDPGL
jgi:hydrogenase nickel incorporation protein HypB